MFTGKTNFGQYLFQGCINLAEVTVSEFPSPRSESNGLTLQDRTREPAPGCLSSTGIHTLALPKHFVAIGAHACDSCRLLKSVDLCNTMIEEIPEFTFGHCTSLREVFLPTTLHTIRVKAFMSLSQVCWKLGFLGLHCPSEAGQNARNTQMAWGLCRRKCFRHLSGHEMATLAAYDPGHGLHPWFRIEEHPSIHSWRGPAINFVRVWVRALARVRSRPAVAKQHSSTRVTNHSCPPLCME